MESTTSQKVISFRRISRSARLAAQPSARFVKNSVPEGEEPITRVLMNPPFALRGGDQEYRFVSRALGFMADGGILFSLLPLDAMFGSRDEKVWRRDELLKKHTLLAVLSLPDELF